MRLRRLAPLCAGLLLAQVAAFASEIEDATRLKDEALEVLQRGSALSTDAKLYAQAVLKLEQAQKLLEQAKAEESGLAQEVSAALFWARKFSTVGVVSEVTRQRDNPGSGPAPGPASGPAPGPAPGPPPAAVSKDTAAGAAGMGPGPESDPRVIEARKAFGIAEQFAKDHAGNDYIVALRWFQVADQTIGTDYSVKALALARAAQERNAAKQAAARKPTGLPDSLEYRLIKQADEQVSAGNYERSFPLYEASLVTQETLLAHRKLGHALFDRAQQLKDELMPLFDPANAAYRKAYQEARKTVRAPNGATRIVVDWEYPPLVEAKKACADLGARARQALAYYDRAFVQFGRVLEMAPQRHDLDAAAHQALCYSVRGDYTYRAKARQLLGSFLADYLPENDSERTLCEYCKTELDRISKSGK
jgi:tetratricopeptide (TPR) repeat protein